MEMGWTIHGYHADESDSMTDYYCPAYWEGVAEKNEYILCVDSNYAIRNSGKEVFKYERPQYDFKANARVAQLQTLVNDHAATEGEKEAAKAAIERILNKVKEEEEKAEREKVLVSRWPVFQENPPHCNWHIEKDGVVVAKGNGAFQFSSLPSWVDPMTEQPKDTWRAWQLTEEQKKELKKFQAFIKKIEGIVSMKIGNGTGDDEYKTITVTEYKTELKPKVIELANLAEDVEPGIMFILNHYFIGCLKGRVYKIVEDIPGRMVAKLMNRKLTKVLESQNNRAFVCNFKDFEKYVNAGYISIVDLEEVKTPYQVEKCVKVKQEKPSKANTQKERKEANKEDNEVSPDRYTYEIKKDIDTRDNSPIFLVSVKEKLGKDEYIAVSKMMRKYGGYYSKFKHAFLFRKDPSAVLQGDLNTRGQIENNICRSEAVEAAQSVLNAGGIEQPTNGNKNAVRANTATKQASKLKASIETLQKKIDSLSGDYLVNTPKRMRQQESRDNTINSCRRRIKLLEYLLKKVESKEELTVLENALVTGSVLDEIHSYYNRYIYYKEHPGQGSVNVKYPEPNYNYPDSWWNQELPKMKARLAKAEIFNTADLLKAIAEYEDIIQIVEEGIPKEDETQRKIKKLESEFKMRQKGDIHFTPTRLVDKLIEYARIDEKSVVLEPSAGIGNIADMVKNITQHVDVVEKVYDFCDLLKLKGYSLVGSDFMEYNPEKKYDAIIANPPFSEEQEHIRHMYDLLSDNGTIVTVCSPHWTFANDKKSIAFREWLDEKTYYVKDVPSGVFDMTNVAAKILVIEK